MDELNLVLGQIKTDEKSNEITVIPELLELIDIKGFVITIDAMGCQKKIAKKSLRKKSDYALPIKGNHESTHDAVKDFFEMDEKHLEKYGVVKIEKECSVDHGRIVTREYFLCADLLWLDSRRQWA